MGLYFRPAEKIASRVVAGEAILVKLPAGEMTVLNESASLLWLVLDGARSEADLARYLQSVYALRECPDIGDFLRDLEERGLVNSADTPDPAPDRRPSEALPEVTDYAPPVVKVAEAIETLAGTCDSSWGGFSSCQTFGVCLDPFD